MELVALVLVFTAALVVAGVIAWFTHQRAKQRRQAFAAFAASQGWNYVPADDRLAVQWSGEPFSAGDHRRAGNVVSGLYRGRQVIAFDYSYQTHTRTKAGRITTTHRYSVVAVELPTALPHLQVEPEGLFGGAVANALGFADLQFESEQFNRRFRVKAADDRFGHAVVHPRMMELLLACEEIGWRFEGDTLVGWDKGNHDPAEVIRRLDQLGAVLDLVPPYVWRDYAGLDPGHR